MCGVWVWWYDVRAALWLLNHHRRRDTQSDTRYEVMSVGIFPHYALYLHQERDSFKSQKVESIGLHSVDLSRQTHVSRDPRQWCGGSSFIWKEMKARAAWCLHLLLGWIPKLFRVCMPDHWRWVVDLKLLIWIVHCLFLCGLNPKPENALGKVELNSGINQCFMTHVLIYPVYFSVPSFLWTCVVADLHNTSTHYYYPLWFHPRIW